MNQTAVVSENPPALKGTPYKQNRWKKNFWGYMFLVPAVIIFVMFLWVPIFKGLLYSFYHVDFVKGIALLALRTTLEPLVIQMF